MKKFFILYLIFLSFNCFIYSQYSLPYDEINKTHIEYGTEGILDSQCVGGLVYDDNTWENGYGWGPNFGIGKWVMLMTPTSYPFTINQVCLALTRYPTQPSLNFTFDIEIYDQTGTGGSPGNLLASVPNQTVTVVPTWPQVEWYDFTNLTGIPAITSGSVYVGISFDPQPPENRQKFIGADESTSTPLRPGYGCIQYAYPWTPIQDIFYYYRSIGIRCDGIGYVYPHNIAAGPFLSLPTLFNSGAQKFIKAKIRNLGSSNETVIPIKFLVNGAQAGLINLNLNAGAIDSVSFSWTPSDTGNYNLKIISALATDQFRTNDTVSANVIVFPPGVITSCIGTGTFGRTFPFTTIYTDSKTDMLYTAAEIGTGIATIWKIGYDVVTASPQVMNGFKVKMQNTTDTAISSFTLTGWTEVFSSNYTVPGTSIQYITLNTPFVYDGTNLLIEICFNNSSIYDTTSSTVATTTASGRCVQQYYNLSTGDGCVEFTSGTVQTSLPNLCLALSPDNTIVGVNNGKTGIPDKFSLSQNYPNPFNPSTIINYQLPISNYVKLTIFDALGREAAVLVNEKQSAGSYSVEWDGTNYSSGLYFYKLECDGFTDVKKMVLIK
jgi:hypothetical protein